MSTPALEELSALPQWVAFRLVPSQKRPGKTDKIPINPRTGKNASVTNPETWGAYDQAVDRARSDKLGGVGFVFTSSDPYLGVDLDGCVIDGEPDSWALAIIERLASYTEISPSGTGVHVIVRSALPAGGNRKGRIELYATGRFLTWTGKVYAGLSAIEERSAAIRALHGELFPPTPAPPAHDRVTAGQTDSELIARAMSAGDGGRFALLWKGDVTGYASPSEADLALTNKLAFWVGPDPERIDGLFRQSGLYRPKWNEKHGGATYGRITIDKALAGRVEFYSGHQVDYAPPVVNGNGYHTLEEITLAREIEADERLQPTDSMVLDLPAAARLPDTLGADVGEWLDDYIRYASLVSERTPAIVNEAAGLWLASVAVARRLYVSMPHGDVYPNLYTLAVAPTTLFAKTTGLSVMTTLLDDALPHLTLSNESTPEALLSELAGKEATNLDAAEITEKERELWRLGQRFAAQRGLVLEEASSLLAGLRKEYMQGMAELLLRLYDCPNSYRRHTRGGGYLVIRQAYTSIVGWTTPARLRTAETNTAWHDGLFARFALLTPEGNPRRPSEELGTRPSRPARLVEDLTRLANSVLPIPERYPDPVIARAVTVDDDAARAWRRYYLACSFDLLTAKNAPDSRLHGTYGRLPAMALKVATLLAALDWAAVGQGNPVVTLGHYAQAQRIAEKWRASSHRLLDLLTTRTEAEEENADLERVLKVLEQMGSSWVTIRDLVRKLDSNRYTTAQIQGLVRILEQDGRAEVQERRAEGGKGGRPSLAVRFCQGKTG